MARRKRVQLARRTRGPRRLALWVALALLLAPAGYAGLGFFGTAAPPAHTQGATDSQQGGAAQVSSTAWDEDAYPDYYRIVGSAVVDVDLAPGEARYEGLDELGRSGRVVALITPEMAEAGSRRDRGDLSDVTPAGWGHNEEVDIPMPDGSTYHGYLYNRSHLLAKSLGGSDEQENLVTGTRTQNVGDNRGQDGGMAYTEGLARTWLQDNPDGTLYYSATPVYEGDELLPRSVIVDVRSSDGEIDLEVEVYNAALGFDIDYETGEFSGSSD